MTTLKRVTTRMIFAASAILVSVSYAAATPITFFGQDLAPNNNPNAIPNSKAAQTQFLSNFSSFQVQSFDTFASGTSVTGAGITVSFGPAGNATLVGSGDGSGSVITNVASVGAFPISSPNYLNQNFDSTLTLTFQNPQVAFGFFATDVSDSGGNFLIKIGNAAPITVLTNGQPSGNAIYFGIIDTANPFTTVVLTNSAPGSDLFGFDDFTICTAAQVVGPSVPEPSTLTLLGIGVAGFIKSRRRRGSSAR